jgi:enamine deaminase RidA (YjgF/YER057c/UK114 family)
MPWSAGCIANGFLFLSGIVGHIDNQDNEVRDLEGQVSLAFSRLLESLESAGSAFRNLVRVNQYLRNVSLRDPYVVAREAYLGSKLPGYPDQRVFASTLLIVEFSAPSILIELEATAVL